MSPRKPPRPRCERCGRPLAYCLCGHIPSIAARTRVLVLQHPDEARHALNTARLAVLGLQNAELLVGEVFPQLGAVIATASRAYLLFPSEQEPAADSEPGLTSGAAASEAASASTAHEFSSSLLIVPDGTWRKAGGIVRANPVLGVLPRLCLAEGAPSAYRIRKAPGPASVSTIEAIVRALEVLEPEGQYADLLRPFHVLVEQQIEAMGEDVYWRNYTRG